MFSDDATSEAGCGPLAGQLVFTEVGFGNDKFVEIKNDFDVPVDMNGASAELVLGEGPAQRQCTLVLPTGFGQSTIEPEEHVLIQTRPTPQPRSAAAQFPRSPRAANGSS